MALARARDIVEAGGLQQLTVRRLAGRMGYSVGTVYNLFESIDEIVLQLHAHTLDALYDALAAAPAGATPEENMREMIDAYFRFTRENPNRWSLLFEERQIADDAVPDWYLEKISRLFMLLEDHLAPLFGPGEDEARRRAARALWCGLHGIWSLAASDKLDIVTGDPMDVVTGTLVEVFIAGLRARAAPGRAATPARR